MKFFRIAFFAALLMLVCHGFSMAQSELNPYALVRIVESSPEFSKIMICYEDGKTEKIALPAMDKSDNTAERMGVITKTLNQMVDKGYKIVSVATTGVNTTTYTMEKVK